VSNEPGAGRAPAAGRGRGLRVAKRAARELGGRVAVISEDGQTRAVIELPARDERRRAA
jgi:signal transduction histidine kinase